MAPKRNCLSKVLSFVLAFVVLFGCFKSLPVYAEDAENDGVSFGASNVMPSSITLSEPSLEMEIGQTHMLTYSLLPDGAEPITVEWLTSDADIATVKDGVVAAVKEGTVEITVRNIDDEDMSAVCLVEVAQANMQATPGITLSDSSITIKIGETHTLNYSLLSEGTEPFEVEWVTSNAEIATVDKGIVTAIAEGKAEVTVCSADDENLAAVCAVEVVAAGDVQAEEQVMGANMFSAQATSSDSKYIAVSAGDMHSMGLKQDGSLWAWGNDSYGQLGIGGEELSGYMRGYVPTEVLLDNVASVSAGSMRRTMAVKKDGTLWAWGDNYDGLLGDNSSDDYKTIPVKILDDVESVSVGYNHAMAIKKGGSLWAWGCNINGQLGDGSKNDRPSPVKILDNVAYVSAGDYRTMAVKKDGTLWLWGNTIGFDYYDPITGNGESTIPIKVLDDVASVSAGKTHAAAIKKDGSLWVWGFIFEGQSGLLVDYSPSPVKVLDNVASVSVGNNHAMAIKKDGSLWAWGTNSHALGDNHLIYGQLGDGTKVSKINPVKILDGVASVSAGMTHTLAVKTDGSLWAWGGNFWHQLGLGQDVYEDQLRPRQITTFGRQSKRAIYVLPGYTGSELYNNNKKIWVDDFPWTDLIGDILGISVLPLDPWGSSSRVTQNGNKDLYGTLDTYKSLITGLRNNSDQFPVNYEVVFFPYNWLGNLNDSAKELESDINGRGFDKVTFVTHSTGGLLAANYIALSNTNKLKVEKAILIAAPLYGTYISLEALENGITKEISEAFELVSLLPKLSPIAYAARSLLTKYVKGFAVNSPTTYQLLPSDKYIAAYPLLYEEYRSSAYAQWQISDINLYYSVLNKSNRINPNLTNGNVRSHQAFRDTVLHGNIADILAEVPTLLIGNCGGFYTPTKAIYTSYTSGEVELDIKYDTTGDNTVTGFSASLDKDERFKFENFSDLNHGQLATDSLVIGYVCDVIAGREPIKNRAFEPASISNGMEDMVKLNIRADQPVDIRIFDNASSDPVFELTETSTIGLDNDNFIFRSFDDDGTTKNSMMYLPNSGYRVEFSYGQEEGAEVNLSLDVSTLNFDGDKTATATYEQAMTQQNGKLLTLDMVSGVTEANLAGLVSGLSASIQEYNADWDWDLSSIPVEDDILVLNDIGDSFVIPIVGSTSDTISWESSDESVVTVSDSGEVTAVGHGFAFIYAYDTSGSYRTLSQQVKVKLETSSISFSNLDIVIDERELIQPVFSSENVTETNIIYSFDDSQGIIEIENGVVIGLSAGDIMVTGTAPGGVSNTFIVHVSEPIEDFNNEIASFYITALVDIGGTVSGDGTFEEDDPVTLTAIPASGYIFDGWYEDGEKVSDEETYSFEATASRTLEARFKPLLSRGDTNGDGRITAADLTYLTLYLARMSGYPRNDAMDLNGDGNVTAADLTYLTLSLARYPGYQLTV